MRRRHLVLLVALVLAAAIAWFARRHDDAPPDTSRDEMPAGSPPAAPPLLAPTPKTPASTTPAAMAPPAPVVRETPGPRVTLHGTTRGPDGEPLAATVYLAKKGAPTNRFVTPPLSTQAHADGTWSLSVPAVAGSWIGAVQTGYQPAFADGDRPDAVESALDLVLERGGLVTVSVVDAEQKPVAGVIARAMPKEGGVQSAFPAPGERFRDVTGTLTGADGLALLHLGGSDPVTVTADLPIGEEPIASATYPSHVDLEKPEGRVEFTVRPACHLSVSFVSAGTGDEVRDGLEVEVVTDPEAEFAHRSGVANWQGPYDLHGDAFRTGTYRVHVTGAGYRPWRSDPILLKEPGDTADVVARLERDPDVGDLVLEVAPSKADGREVPIDGRTFLAQWRRHERPADSWAPPPAGASWDSISRELTIARMPLAALDLLLWDSSADGMPCAALANAVVRPGSKNRYAVHLVPGTKIPVEGLYGADEARPGIDVRAEGWDRLPSVVFFGPGTATFSDSGGSWARKFTLGPYPFESLVVTLVASDGSKREVNYPRH